METPKNKTVDVVLYAAAATAERIAGNAVAVTDVFRATSVIVEALHNGAERVIPVVTVEEAFLLRDKFHPSKAVLGGEREMIRVEGFDLGNSPMDYTPEKVRDKTVIISTTNGTRAIHNSRHATEIYIASFLNMGAVCRKLAASDDDITIVCSGRKDRFTAEDGLCAGAMAGILAAEYGYALTDIADVMRRMWDDSRGDIRERLSTTRHYNDMMCKGLDPDIEFSLRQDIYDIVPQYTKMGDIIL